ncbi:Ig-like domain-containing protein [Thalassotalea eurytherma]|uniref:Tandem-95 repeat protein n=1 Tax=Thalassotalea eurytherma TaxID=1144278 RepID=A0ABQ6GZS0_9GAMM|nr:Ig-like domain-containing protein [Thalassotalea eurytherma]GLX81461.1 hypothetical protein theurythT_09130 [Thalassotalea eurytherma]
MERFSLQHFFFICLISLITACGGSSNDVNSEPPVNDAPVASAQSVSVNEDESISITLTGSDSDGTISSYNVGTPASGTITGTAPDLTYTPNTDFNGSDSFTYTVTDDDGATSSEAIVSITVTPVNDDPIASAQSVSVNENESISITLTGSDSDGTIASYNVGTPANGTVTGTPPNLTYTPNTDFNGNDSFAYTVTDDGGATSSEAIISITITTQAISISSLYNT